MAATYEPIATTTLGSDTTTVTFSSIAGTYTDLVLIMSLGEQVSQTNGVRVRIGNGSTDTGSNYSNTYLIGNGTAASSQRQSNITYFDIAWNASPSSTLGNYNAICNFQNYANTTTYKTALLRVNSSNQSTEAVVGLWRSTSAINIIDIYTGGGASNKLLAGSTFTLYGIKAA